MPRSSSAASIPRHRLTSPSRASLPAPWNDSPRHEPCAGVSPEPSVTACPGPERAADAGLQERHDVGLAAHAAGGEDIAHASLRLDPGEAIEIGPGAGDDAVEGHDDDAVGPSGPVGGNGGWTQERRAAMVE